MEEILYGVSLRPVFAAGHGEVEIYEFTVSGEWAGKPLNQLVPGENCVVISLTRAGAASVPETGTLMQTGDLVLVSATLEGIKCLRDSLNEDKE